MSAFRTAASLALYVSLASATRAQAPVPVEREPQHKQVFENASLRLLDVVLPPGYVSLFHVHSNDNVSVRIATGPTRVDLPGADGEPTVPPVGRVVFNSAVPPYTHRVANVGTTPIHIIDVEILRDRPATSAATPVATSPSHTLVVENSRVRIHRVVVGTGEVVAAHSHGHAWLEVVVTGAEPGRSRWYSPGTSVPVLRGAAELVEIEVR